LLVFGRYVILYLDKWKNKVIRRTSCWLNQNAQLSVEGIDRFYICQSALFDKDLMRGE